MRSTMPRKMDETELFQAERAATKAVRGVWEEAAQCSRRKCRLGIQIGIIRETTKLLRDTQLVEICPANLSFTDLNLDPFSLIANGSDCFS